MVISWGRGLDPWIFTAPGSRSVDQIKTIWYMWWYCEGPLRPLGYHYTHVTRCGSHHQDSILMVESWWRALSLPSHPCHEGWIKSSPRSSTCCDIVWGPFHYPLPSLPTYRNLCKIVRFATFPYMLVHWCNYCLYKMFVFFTLISAHAMGEKLIIFMKWATSDNFHAEDTKLGKYDVWHPEQKNVVEHVSSTSQWIEWVEFYILCQHGIAYM